MLATSRQLAVLMLLSWVIASSSAQQANTTLTGCNMDIVFIVDASGSVGSTNFDKTLKFVEVVVQGLTVGPFDTRVGMFLFNSANYLRFHLNTYFNKQDVLDAVAATVYTGGGTDTARALAYATDTSFTTLNGMRTTAAQVAVVITDGQSNTYVNTEAQRLQDKGVTVFAVGVGGGIDESELQIISSDPDSAHVFSVDNFDALNLILAALQQGACKSEAAFLCGGQADIMFLLDESDSVGANNFQKMLEFVQHVADAFIVGPNDVQIGVSSFSNGYLARFALSAARSKADLAIQLSRLTYFGGGTNTAYALSSLRQFAFSASQGSRPGVPKIAIVVTDGKSDDTVATAREAQAARDAGIVLLVIGIGFTVDDVELAAIATDPDVQNVHWATTYDALSGLEYYVAAAACAVAEGPSSNSYTNCGPQGDLVFLVDTSGSVGKKNFQLLLSFINNFLKDLQIGEDNIRVGLAKFGSRPYKEFDLNRYYNKEDLMDAIRGIKYLSGGTDTASALTYMDQIMFKTASGNRPGIPDIGVVITDGKSNKPANTELAAIEARYSGIEIFSVGVGSSISVDELNAIASDPDNTHVLTVSEFTKLSAIRDAFKVQACAAIPQNLTNATIVTPTQPAPVDLCQDLISNCAAYPSGTCTGFRLWAGVFCAKTCQICSPNFQVEPPPCEDTSPICANIGVGICTGSSQTFAEENCRKFCGYCGQGSQTSGFFNTCYYNGNRYRQGEKWQDGCAYDCECADAQSGQYVCYNKCPSYFNLPPQCTLTRQQGECCLTPVCNFQGTYNFSSFSLGSGVCEYKGMGYNQGQLWSDGCQRQCLCQNAAKGSYICQSLCAQYDSLPGNCKLEKRPGDCCAKPRCEYETQLAVVTGSGSTSGPGGAAGSAVGRRRRRDTTGVASFNGTVDANSTVQSGCVFKGSVYGQGDQWDDGCDRTCICDDASVGFWRCQQRCPDFTNLPANCSMVTVLGQCCKSVFCDTEGSFTSSQTLANVTGSVPEPRPDPGPGDYPTLPPNSTYAPGQDPDPVSNVAPPVSNSTLLPLPPQLSCPTVMEGDDVTLTCLAEVANCKSLFVFDWSFDSRDLATCGAGSCGGPFTLLEGVNVTMDAAGSMVTIQNVTRESRYANSPWTCEFCGGSEVACEIDVYVPPESPSCTVTEEFDPMTGDIEGVRVNCSTDRVYPEAVCTFLVSSNGDLPVFLAARPGYTHTPDNVTSVNYFRSECYVSVSVQNLGEGSHSFLAYIYPDVYDGMGVATRVMAQTSVTLSLPQAAHTCPPNILDDFLCGKPSVCNCTLVHPGYPKGDPVWYSRDVIQSQAQDGAMVISYDGNSPTLDYTCEAVSVLGRRFGSSLKFGVETKCN